MTEHQVYVHGASQISLIELFMRIGGQSVNRFNADQTLLYLGLMCEEMAETLDVLRNGGVDESSVHDLREAVGVLKRVSDGLKKGRHIGDLARCDLTELLDGMIDTAWVSVGATLSLADDARGAFREVASCNLAKYPGGKAIRDENGKIVKPSGWKGPNLQPYLSRHLFSHDAD